MPNYKLDSIDPKKLAEHPLNAELYSTQPSPEFFESVKARGIDEPIAITQSGIIISGRCRRIAAIAAGITDVPVRVYLEELDDLAIRQLLIESNYHRPKSTEERAREFKELKRIEEARAKQRQTTSTGGANPRVKAASGTLPEADKGEARDKAAKQAGLPSGRTAERAAAVVDKIDEAQRAGDTPRADSLRQELNHGTVGKAHRLATNQELGSTQKSVVDELGKKVPQHLHAVFSARATFKALLTQLRTMKGDVRQLADTDGGARLAVDLNQLQQHLDNARNCIKFNMPYCLCCYCDGRDKSCKACRGSGWITEATKNQLPPNTQTAERQSSTASVNREVLP